MGCCGKFFSRDFELIHSNYELVNKTRASHWVNISSFMFINLSEAVCMRFKIEELTLGYYYRPYANDVISVGCPHLEVKRRLFIGQSCAPRVQICAFWLFRHRFSTKMAAGWRQCIRSIVGYTWKCWNSFWGIMLWQMLQQERFWIYFIYYDLVNKTRASHWVNNSSLIFKKKTTFKCCDAITWGLTCSTKCWNDFIAYSLVCLQKMDMVDNKITLMCAFCWDVEGSMVLFFFNILKREHFSMSFTFNSKN